MVYPTVLCIGEILYDRIADQPTETISAVKSWTDHPGGAPANVATALVKLGTSTGFIGAVGDDALGKQLVEVLNQVGVDTTGVQRIQNAPTRTVLVLRSESGDRTFAAFGDHHPTESFADTKLAAEAIPIELFAQAKYLVLGTLECAYPESKAAILRALSLAKQHQLTIILDVNWRPVFWRDAAIAQSVILDLIKQADYLKLSDEEAEWLFPGLAPNQIASQFLNLQAVLLTAGAQGCHYWWQGQSGHLPAFKIDVIDTTGAGDSFLAGFVHQLTQAPTSVTATAARQAILYANAAGALTTLKLGAIAAQPQTAEITEFLKQVESH